MSLSTLRGIRLQRNNRTAGLPSLCVPQICARRGFALKYIPHDRFFFESQNKYDTDQTYLWPFKDTSQTSSNIEGMDCDFIGIMTSPHKAPHDPSQRCITAKCPLQILSNRRLRGPPAINSGYKFQDRLCTNVQMVVFGHYESGRNCSRGFRLDTPYTVKDRAGGEG